jgi:hypothetical protein
MIIKLGDNQWRKLTEKVERGPALGGQWAAKTK